jgi:hypothetical protein
VDARASRNANLTDPVIVAAICAVPRDFRAGAGSPVQLVRQSGYRDIRETITATEIRKQLIDDPSLIDDWKNWSLDKRTSEGWYLQVHGEGGYIGYVGRTDPEVFFRHRAKRVPNSSFAKLRVSMAMIGIATAPPNER